jgi:tRNA(fMet)-specific endonuclease VapC
VIYLLDTDILIFIIRGMKSSGPRRVRAEQIRDRIKDAKEAGDTIGISAVTKAELEYGAAKADDPLKEQEAFGKIISPFILYAFDPGLPTKTYGSLRHGLEKSGQMIGAMDLLIAAHAIALGAVLVSNNLREFQRIPALTVENWS